MSEPNMDVLIKALIEGDATAAASQAKSLTEAGVSTERIVTDGVESAMGTLDAKCTLEQFNLLEIMLVGRAVTEVMKHLFPAGADPSGTKGTVVIATLEGDVHDLGKNILKMVLTGNGFRVVDCGKDCPLDKLFDTVERERPVAVGISERAQVDLVDDSGPPPGAVPGHPGAGRGCQFFKITQQTN